MVRKRRTRSTDPKARFVAYEAPRAIGIRWRCGNRAGEVSAETRDREEAIGVKAILIDRLRRGIFPGAEDDGPDITWKAFRERYNIEYVTAMSEGSRSAWTTAANWLEKLCKPKRLAEVDKGMLSRFSGALAAEGLSPNSIATYLRTIRAGLGWAHELGLLEVLPSIRARKGLKVNKSMRSRPITGEEFERIIKSAVKVRPRDYKDWQRFLHGLSLSTLRVDELRRLSWDDGAELAIDVTGRYPMIRMRAEGHKSREDCYQPITPEFWAVLSERGQSRTGYAFPLAGRRGQQMTRKRVIRIISDIGSKAGVITDPTTGKTATSHDIGRRAGITRLAGTLTMSQTQQWARHSDPRTTSQFYIRHEAEKLAEAVGWTKPVAKVLRTSKTTARNRPAPSKKKVPQV